MLLMDWFKSRSRSCKTSGRLNNSNWRVRRRRVERLAGRSPRPTPIARRKDCRRLFSKLACIWMTARMLLKSCATPPASWPMASIFCAWRNCFPHKIVQGKRDVGSRLLKQRNFPALEEIRFACVNRDRAASHASQPDGETCRGSKVGLLRRVAPWKGVGVMIEIVADIISLLANRRAGRPPAFRPVIGKKRRL
jgi:hypothetical protein